MQEKKPSLRGETGKYGIERRFFICTGSPCSVYDDFEWIKNLKQFVHDICRKRKKIVGICFGHQIIAEALGGKVACSSKGWGIGIQEARIEQTREWMIPGMDELNILVSYKDQVITLPAEGILLAENSHCRNFMFEVQNIALGIQGHPEFDRNYAKALFLSRRESIGHERIEKAMSSLNNCLHPEIFTKWIYNFFLSS
jgi:GMP synthase-like glutamine amidotransferase